jgi:hypothetical protein
MTDVTHILGQIEVGFSSRRIITFGLGNGCCDYNPAGFDEFSRLPLEQFQRQLTIPYRGTSCGRRWVAPLFGFDLSRVP